MSAVIRVEKNREYVVMSNQFLRNKELSLKAKGLLALCLSLPDSWDYSMSGLVAICKESVTSVRSTLKELESFGYMRINKLKDEKGRFIYEYTIYEVPPPESPGIENLHVENQQLENLSIENMRELNIKELNIKKESIKEENKLFIYIKEHISNKELQQLYKDYVEMREQIKKPLTERGLKMIITRCERLSNCNMNVQKLLLENAIINNWLNVYVPKEEEIKTAHKHVLDELKGFYGE